MEPYKMFAAHLVQCHSWYKHLSLEDGGHFIIVVDPNAGAHYAAEHPRLPFGNSPDGYKKAFGQLAYFWKNFDEAVYQSDTSSGVYTEEDITGEFLEFIKIRLYPYMSDAFSEAINFNKHDFDRIVQGQPHEAAAELIKLYNLHAEMDSLWQKTLTEEERAWIANERSGKQPTLNMKRYAYCEAEFAQLLMQLHAQEVQKIEKAIITLLKL